MEALTAVIPGITAEVVEAGSALQNLYFNGTQIRRHKLIDTS
jgi:hypothetical protein